MRLVNVALLGLCITSPALAQQQPLSAIDWLDELVAVPIAQPGGGINEPNVTDTAAAPKVDVLPLESASADAVGLLAPSTTGLPLTLWSASTTKDLIAALAGIAPDPLPALQALYYTLLLAEADAPGDAGQSTRFLLARTQALQALGAVDPANALLDRAGAQTRDLFDAWFDLALLTGDEDRPCQVLRASPGLSASYANRIFCIARAGDWATAALTYETATGLDALSDIEAELLGLYLDPELIEDGALPRAPKSMSPLVFRLFEAAGNPYPTNRLPRAYAMSDLRGNASWRTEIEAAERLTRTGALPPNRLLGLYTDRKAAASGGVWDRVSAVQDVDAALRDGDAAAMEQALPRAWRLLKNRGLSVAFSQLYAEPLRAADLSPKLQSIAFDINLLSEDYETAISVLDTPTAEQSFLASVAGGAPDLSLARTGQQHAIVRGFSTQGPARDHRALVRNGKIGEAILAAAGQLDRAREGNLADLSDGLKTLRALGLEDTARRAALQILILGPS